MKFRDKKNTYQFTPASRDDRYCLINVLFFETTWASDSLTGRINLGLYPRNYVHTYYSTQCGTGSMPLQVASPCNPTSVWILVCLLASPVFCSIRQQLSSVSNIFYTLTSKTFRLGSCRTRSKLILNRPII
jgi:hypothetical protein